MFRLLIANFARIKKSKLFWILCGVMAALGILALISLLVNEAGSSQVGVAMGDSIIPTEIAVAVFVSLFFGTEYSDGTIRNKLIVGHDRRQIYLANFIIAVICAICFSVSYMLPIVLICFPGIGVPSAETAKIIFVGLATLVAFCALFIMVSMIFKNKAGATVVNLMLAFVLLVFGIIICNYLNEPEFIPVFSMGEMEYVPNPRYPVGAARTFLQILLNISPGGQAIQFMMGVTCPLWVLPLYSIGVLAVCTVVGMVVFDRIDIK